MKSKKEIKLIICAILIILVIIAIVILLLINKPEKPNNNADNNGNSNSNDNNTNYVIVPDDDLVDNEKLIGNWNSIRTEVYEDNELVLSFIDTTDKNLQIYSSSGIKVCYISEGDLICTDGNYSYVNSKLYVDVDTYLSNESELMLEENKMIIKSIINDSEYSLLYLEKN